MAIIEFCKFFCVFIAYILYHIYFTGDLLSVNPRIAKWIPDLFSLNERAVFVGSWKHGFFCFGAVGATNVGNIRVVCDEVRIENVLSLVWFVRCFFKVTNEICYLAGKSNSLFSLSLIFAPQTLHTNIPKWPKGQPTQRDKFLGLPGKGVQFKKGEHFGEFRLGSTIVLLFEAPKDFKFDLERGQRIEMGCALSKLFK